LRSLAHGDQRLSEGALLGLIDQRAPFGLLRSARHLFPTFSGLLMLPSSVGEICLRSRETLAGGVLVVEIGGAHVSTLQVDDPLPAADGEASQ